MEAHILFFLVSLNKLHLVKIRSEKGCEHCCAFGNNTVSQ